jgi:putative transposase
VVFDCRLRGLRRRIARQPGKRRVERIRISEIQPDHAPRAGSKPILDLVAVPEEAWQVAVRRLTILKPLLSKGRTARTLANVKEVARVLGKHPATIYRWIRDYKHSERLLVFLRKKRSDRGTSRLSSEANKIVDTAIKKIYLKELKSQTWQQ